jgi:hypothetical protein
MLSFDLDLYVFNIWTNDGDVFNITLPTWLLSILIVGFILIKRKKKKRF